MDISIMKRGFPMIQVVLATEIAALMMQRLGHRLITAGQI